MIFSSSCQSMKPPKSPHLSAIAFLALLFFFAPQRAEAEDYKFNGGSTASAWGTTTFWTPNGTPGASDNIIGFGGLGGSLTFNSSREISNMTHNTSDSTLTNSLIRGIGTLSLTIGGNLSVDFNDGSLSILPNTTSHNISVLIAGDITVSNGTLNLGSTTVANGLFALSQTNTSTTTVGGALNLNLTNNAVATLGHIAMSDGTLTLNLGGSTAGGTIVSSLAGSTGTVRGGTGSNATTTLTINSTTNTIYSGILANGSSSNVLTVVKTGAGTQVLSGVNTYTGSTTVEAGTLQIDGSTAAASAVTVQSAGVLGGVGTVGGNTTIQAGATLAPGNSPGVLSFGSNLTLEGNVVMELNGLVRGTGYDGIDVAGALAYGGGLTLNFGTTFANGSSFSLFDFGSATGSFETITLEGSYIGTLVNSGGVWSGNVGGQDFEFVQADGTLSVVPEPSATMLLALAAAGGWALRIRRRFS
jgi:autotransporter-associated beta strand protein